MFQILSFFYSLQITIYHYSLDLLLQRGSSVINCSRVAVNEEGNLGSAQPGAGSLRKQYQPSSALRKQPAKHLRRKKSRQSSAWRGQPAKIKKTISAELSLAQAACKTFSKKRISRAQLGAGSLPNLFQSSTSIIIKRDTEES